MVKNLLEAEWLTAEFQVVLDQIFARFDADDDGLWSINEELQSFAMYGIVPPTGHFTSSCEGTPTRLITASRGRKQLPSLYADVRHFDDVTGLVMVGPPFQQMR